jgi:hypothetical protein
MGGGFCHKELEPIAQDELEIDQGLPVQLFSWFLPKTFHEVPVPTLFRFLAIVALLVVVGFAAIWTLATFVQPTPREISVPVSTQQPST